MNLHQNLWNGHSRRSNDEPPKLFHAVMNWSFDELPFLD